MIRQKPSRSSPTLCYCARRHRLDEPARSGEFVGHDVRGFVQHTLPSRFQKVRYYGCWMSPNGRIQTDELRWLVWLFLGWTYWLASRSSQPKSKPEHPRCSECGGGLRAVMVTDYCGRVLYQHALAYLDSG